MSFFQNLKDKIKEKIDSHTHSKDNDTEVYTNKNIISPTSRRSSVSSFKPSSTSQDNLTSNSVKNSPIVKPDSPEQMSRIYDKEWSISEHSSYENESILKKVENEKNGDTISIHQILLKSKSVDNKIEYKTESKIETKKEVKTEFKSEVKSEVISEIKSEFKTENIDTKSKVEIKSEMITSATIASKSNSKVESEEEKSVKFGSRITNFFNEKFNKPKNSEETKPEIKKIVLADNKKADIESDEETGKKSGLFGFVSEGFSNIGNKITTMKQKYHDRVDGAKEKLINQVWMHLENKVDTLLEEKLRPGFFGKILDDHMPDIVFNNGRRFLNVLWLDIREEFWFHFYKSRDRNQKIKLELKEEAKGKKKKHSTTEVKVEPEIPLSSFEQFQNSPYDKTSWESSQSNWYMLFNILKILPLYCFNFWSALVYFLCMDKTDEYILRIKGTQFISLGVIEGLSAWAKYYSCATWNHGSLDACILRGPGDDYYFVAEILGFIIQLILVWQCFQYLPNSVVKGKPENEVEDLRDHGRYFRQVKVPKLSLFKLLSEDDDNSMKDEFDESDADESKVSVVQASIQEEEFCEEIAEKSTLGKVVEVIINKLKLHDLLDTFKSYWPDFDKMLTAQNSKHPRGRYLSSLLNYDLVVFSCIISTLIIFLFTRPYSILFGSTFEYNWMLRADIIMLKTLYGLLSLPFLIFVSPLAPIILHMRPTAYNKNGECVPVNIVKKYTDEYRTSTISKSKVKKN